MGVKTQECRTEVGGGGQSHPLTPPQGVPLGLLVLPPQAVISMAGSDASGSSGGGEGVICSPGALESLLLAPPGAARAPVLNH